MPDGQPQPGTALTAAQEFDHQLDQQARNFAIMLPQHVPLEKFKRVVVTAVIQDPKLFNADRRSLFVAAQKCASDGLLPDGREAVLLPFNSKVKRRLPDGTQQEAWVDLVQYIPMVQGIRTRMRNTGLVTSSEAYVVHRNDKFFQKFGSTPQIVHEPPALGTPRGEPVGAYAIIRLTSGEIIQEVMDYDEIERIRSFSKAKDGPAWKNHWGEMARKTVLRRAAKSAPTSAEMAEMLSRDDELPDMPTLAEMPEIEPEPQRQIGGGPQSGNSYVIVDADGEEHEYRTAEATLAALVIVMRDARKRGRPALDAALENNAATIRSLPAEMQAELDPFGLPPSREQASPHDAAERPGAAAADWTAPGPSPSEPLPNIGKHIAKLEPPRADLASDEPDWRRYADGMCELIGRASETDLNATRFSELPHMQKMRARSGDDYRRVMDAVRARSAALQERAA